MKAHRSIFVMIAFFLASCHLSFSDEDLQTTVVPDLKQFVLDLNDEIEETKTFPKINGFKQWFLLSRSLSSKGYNISFHRIDNLKKYIIVASSKSSHGVAFSDGDIIITSQIKLSALNGKNEIETQEPEVNPSVLRDRPFIRKKIDGQ